MNRRFIVFGTSGLCPKWFSRKKGPAPGDGYCPQCETDKVKISTCGATGLTHCSQSACRTKAGVNVKGTGERKPRKGTAFVLVARVQIKKGKVEAFTVRVSLVCGFLRILARENHLIMEIK